MPPTIRPMRARFVWAPMKPSAVQPSSIGSSTAPTLRIWNRWSITQIESKPTSSAVRTIRSRWAASSRAPPGNVNEETWRPNFTSALRRVTVGRRSVPPRRGFAAGSTEQVEGLGHEDVADRAVAARERGAADQGNRSTRVLAKRQLGRRCELVRHGTHGRLHEPAVVIWRAPQVVEREQARDTDRDVDDAEAPRPPERAGDDGGRGG